jgi:hypothetical protein
MADEEGPTDAAPAPELLIASLLHLMSHYLADIGNAGSGANLSVAIERHFQALSVLPGLPPVLRGTCSQLSRQWAPLVASNSARVRGDQGGEPVLARLRRWVLGPAR